MLLSNPQLRVLSLLLTLPLAVLASTLLDHDNHALVHERLTDTWYQDSDSRVHALFPRDSEDVTYVPVGSPAWSQGFPGRDYDPSKVPQAWKDAMQAAVNAGKIPNIPPSKNTPGTNPVYPDGYNPNSPQVCSATYKCRAPGDLWDAPNDVFGTSFDDGPQTYTTTLVNFLSSKNVITTHFMIGLNILAYPNQFLLAFDKGHDIAAHTWTHPYMTTLSNEQVLAELGWSVLLIRNSTEGKVPKYWRPPYGDCDNRVRAIAKEVFNLQTVMWNQDTRDWSLTTGGTTPDNVEKSMQSWLSGPKYPGLIILEHELSEASVDAFIRAFPMIGSYGWRIESVARLLGGSAYQDTDNLGFTNAAADVSHDTNAPDQHPNKAVTGKSAGPISAPYSYKAFSNSAFRQIPGFFSATFFSGVLFLVLERQS